ncbi:Hypothetical predicted protein [Mytilus galloprovincialis]|uniref:ZMYM2-like/QRICH1 C-terminal domain-containing protein n=1 Tax=Mytilus galloprovincialis TaxID=29158 RepID=A0A8B6F0V1_MYTGA|nr:Hypothetical predicted protein [Mytilus galloprovincialis]
MPKRKKITNGEEMMDALLEDIFRYEELAELEAEAIRHNVTDVANSVRYEELEVEVEQPTMPQTDMTAQLLRDDDQDDDNKENDEESFSIKNNPEFAHSRRVLETKKKSLKSMGKGNNPNKADSLTGDEIAILRGKGIFGTQNPEVLLNAIWLNNGAYFGLRGRHDHVNMLWGDVLLEKTSNGKEYLEFNERSSKTRSGKKVGDYRPVQPKVFEEPKAGEKCPIHIYKEYSRHRPTVDHDSRFYLMPLVDPKTNVWFSKQWPQANTVSLGPITRPIQK